MAGLIRLVFSGLLCLLFCAAPCHAQPLMARYSADTQAINRLLDTVDRILNPDSAIVMFDSTLKLSIDAGYADGAYLSVMVKGIKYVEKEDYAQARKCFTEGFRYAAKTRMKDAVAWCYNSIGDTYLDEGDYDLATQYYYTTLQEMKKAGAGNTHTRVNIWNNMGKVNLRLGDTAKAMAYYNEAEKMAQAPNLTYQLAESYMNKGELYTALHRPDSAIIYFGRVMQIGRETGKVDLVAFADNDLGLAYIEKQDYPRAVTSLRGAISIAAGRFPYIVVGASCALGDAWYHMRQYKAAEAILRSALAETREHHFRDKYADCYGKLADVLRATGQYKDALTCTDTLMALRDSLTGTEKTKAIGQMEIKYRTAEKDKQIAQSQLLIAQQKNNLSRQNNWIISVVAGAVLLALLLLLLYRNARHKERLQEERIKTLQREATIAVLKGVVQGEENERRRLARELHDGIGGMLSAAMMRLMALHHENEAVTAVPAYHEVLNLLDGMGDEIRKTAHNLMPEVLLKQTLPDAVRAYCNSLQAADGLNIEFQCYGDFSALPEHFRLNVYRIIQELMKNMVQHAQARHALVQLMMNENALTVTVEDDGIGFDPAHARQGLGLHNLTTRVSSMEGRMTLDTAPGSGTSVYIEFETPFAQR